VSLSIRPLEAGFRGELTIRAGRSQAERVLSSQRCDELVDALALVAALALKNAAPLASRATAPPMPLPPRAPASRAPRPWQVGAGLAGGVLQGVAPTPAGGGELFVQLTVLRWLHPSVEVGASLFGQTDHLAGRDVRFLWAAGHLTVCPLRLATPGERFSAAPCARLDLGGQRVGAATTRTTAWVAPALLARGRLRLTRWLGLEAELGASFPLLRYRYAFSPGPTVYTVPVAGLYGRGGVVAWF
jgi:hypothetical protein